jgi:CheY-like chemotaxis protein
MQAAEKMFDSAALVDTVRGLMERRGIARRQQCKELAQILHLSFSQAHRKLNGASPWTLEQLKKLTDHFGEPLGTPDQVSAPHGGDSHGAHGGLHGEQHGEIHDAVFVVGERELPCMAWIGAQVGPQYRAEFVAVQEAGGTWRVVENSALLPAHLERRQVDKIEIHVHQPHQHTIAVLDDDRNSADNLRDYLNEIGFKASAFYSHAALQAAMQEVEFDGFVVDWLLGNATTEELIRSIRLSGQASAPIILLTGQLITGKANESEVARVIMQFNVNCQEKPTRLTIIAAELSNALNHP